LNIPYWVFVSKELKINDTTFKPGEIYDAVDNGAETTITDKQGCKHTFVNDDEILKEFIFEFFS
jgi:hypothetical protein